MKRVLNFITKVFYLYSVIKRLRESAYRPTSRVAIIHYNFLAS